MSDETKQRLETARQSLKILQKDIAKQLSFTEEQIELLEKVKKEFAEQREEFVKSHNPGAPA